MPCVYIPVQNSSEEVRVPLDQLPADASDILDILKAEQAPLDLWLTIAREYFKQGKVEQFVQILEEGSSSEIDEYYGDVKYERIAILNALGTYHTFLGKSDIKHKENHFMTATQYYNRASRIDIDASTWVAKGLLYMAKGEFKQAHDMFKIVLDGDPNHVAALIGQACVEFNVGENENQYKRASESYKKSLEKFKQALILHPKCPGAVRLGIGLCRYRLGQFEKARLAFQRVLQLDPENVEALVALGVMDSQANEADGIQRGMLKMKKAFEIYPHCAMALNYLANHFFFTGQHFLVEQLTEAALSATSHGMMRAHSYYNLARSYHSKGDFEKAGRYYMASVNEISRPLEFVLPYYGLGQVQLKLGDLKSSLSSFGKVLEVHPENSESLKAVGHIYSQLGQNEKAIETFRKASRIDPKDVQAFMELGELLLQSDAGAALDVLRTAYNLYRSEGDVPIELLNNIGVIYFEKEEFLLAEQTFKEALGRGVWLAFLDKKFNLSPVDCTDYCSQYRDMKLFIQLEEEGHSLELPWDKVTTLFNYARLLEQKHDTDTACIFYRLILFKYPKYIDAYLRLAAMARERNNIPLSIEMIGDALKVDDKCPNALSMLGNLELKNDDWVKAKETIRAAKDATDGKDSYASISLGNWNYYAAERSERRGANLEATHLEKAKELYTKVLMLCPANLYAANGAGVVLAEKGQFDVSKDIFTQVQEAASGSIFVQMPDVWVNLANVYFAQGQFSLAIKMYQNCLRKFYYGTDTQILLYLARTHYEAEQWQDCKKTLLRAIHLAPSNYIFRFDAGVAMQKFSACTLQKAKKSVEEIRAAVVELKNAIRVFRMLSAASAYHSHGFDENKISTHINYCKTTLDHAQVHCEAAEREERQSRERLEVARRNSLAEEAQRKAEEQRKFQLERRKQEDELKQIMQQEEHFERIKEQWKTSSNTPSSNKRKDKPLGDDEGSGHGEKRRKRGGKRRKQDKITSHSEIEDERDMEEHEFDDEDVQAVRYDDEADTENAQDHLLAAGLEDSDAEDDPAASTVNRRKQSWSESDEEDEQKETLQESTPHENKGWTGSDEEGGNGNMGDFEENQVNTGNGVEEDED